MEKDIAKKPPGSLPMIRTLAGVAILAGVLIAMTFQLTEPIIKEKKAIRLQNAVYEVIPGAKKIATFKADGDRLVALTADEEKVIKVHAGYDEENVLLGVAMVAQGQGFQDIIQVIYGYSPEQEAIVGMKVLESKETPGLGDKIEKDANFRANFKSLDVKVDETGKALLHPITVVKAGKKENPWEIDAITGATISSKAIGRLLQASAAARVPLVRHNLQRLQGDQNE